MLSKLNQINRSPFYWLAIIVIGLSMEAVALYYQYGLDYGPCTLCTHVRAWVLAGVLVAILGLIGRKQRHFNTLCQLGLLGLSGGLMYTSWQTLGVERGFIEGSCDFDAGYPAWLPLHEWWPAVFEPWELCGYTPELLFGITMAEGLVAIAAGSLLAFLLTSLAAIRNLFSPA